MGAAAASSARLQSSLLLLFCVGGIYSAYLTQGIVSEHLQMKRYGSDQARFKNLEALNGVQSLVCFLWAYAILVVQRRSSQSQPGSKQQAEQLPPWTAYWRPALTNSIGPACGLIALKNISYPAQVLNCSSYDQPNSIALSHCISPVMLTSLLGVHCEHPTFDVTRCWPRAARWCPS